VGIESARWQQKTKNRDVLECFTNFQGNYFHYIVIFLEYIKYVPILLYILDILLFTWYFAKKNLKKFSSTSAPQAASRSLGIVKRK
jgi:hypothetical protein